MKLPTQKNTVWYSRCPCIALMVPYTDTNRWAWPLLYVFLILVGMGMENNKK